MKLDGALTAGQFWEITAAPDIRVQAKAVAEEIAAKRPRTHSEQRLDQSAIRI